MITSDFSQPDERSTRIAFTQASSLQVGQALTDAAERLVRLFPRVTGAIWGDLLRQLQPDLLVSGKAATFDWWSFARRAQGLAASPQLSTLSTPPRVPVAAQLTEQLLAYQPQVVQAVAELQENTRVISSLVQALLSTLAQSTAVASGDPDATPDAGPQPASDLRPQALELPLPPAGTADIVIDSLDREGQGLGFASPSAQLHKKGLNRGPRRSALKRRTFRDIVRHHPRSDGRFGFTVRELCTTMHISAASLTEVRDNPGRLSLNAVVALAEAMGENPLQVFMDLLAEAGAKPIKKRKNQETRLPRPLNSALR